MRLSLPRGTTLRPNSWIRIFGRALRQKTHFLKAVLLPQFPIFDDSCLFVWLCDGKPLGKLTSCNQTVMKEQMGAFR